MKSITPASTAAAILASLPVANVSAQDLPYAKPTVRFTPYYKLDTTTQNIIEEKLGYVETTWNNFGLAPVEKKRWESLSSNERDGAMLLGFHKGTWDCFVNHYEDYTWDELEEEGVQESYEGLGWTREHWEHTAEGVPYSEARWWGQLTGIEKEAAAGICYLEDNWDRKDMNPNPTFFPHPMPGFRYRPWNELTAVTRQVAHGMMNYTGDKWNHLGTSLVEKNTFFNLEPDQRAGAMDLGFYTHTWDCFMNHYLAYYWSSFHEDLRVAVETLGWNEAMWSDDGDEIPSSEGKTWEELTAEEKAAATRLCYFEEVWNNRPIHEWYDYETGENKAIKTADGPVPKDINLEIFETTGYVGKEPGQVGKEPGNVGVAVYTVAEIGETKSSSSSYRFVSTAVLALAISVGFF